MPRPVVSTELVVASWNVLAAPWAYAGVSAWIDRTCLGRRFSIAHAALHFADSLHTLGQTASMLADLRHRHLISVF